MFNLFVLYSCVSMHSYINTSFFYLSDLSLLPSMRLDACIHYGLKIKGKKKKKKILRKKTTQKKNEKHTKTAFIITFVNSVFVSFSIIIKILLLIHFYKSSMSFLSMFYLPSSRRIHDTTASL